MQEFREGFEFFCESTGTIIGADTGSNYVGSVDSAINNLINDLNQFEGYKTDASKLQGDIAEFWHADTFNIDAAVKGSSHKAYVERSHDFASEDISTNFGDKYGLKYYKDGVQSAKAQAKSVFERFKEYKAAGGKDSLDKFLEDRGYSNIDSVLSDPIYSGQQRLIPKDQLQDAIDWLERKIAKESTTRPEQVKRYQETLNLLRDRISDGEGTESIALSREDAQKLAELAKEGKINAEELGLTTEELITYEYILQQAFKAGLTAATISAVLKLAPEIIKSVYYLIQHGAIDAEYFKSMGFAAVSGGAEGFIRGTVSAGLTVTCKAGLLGPAAKEIDPNAIAIATVLLMDTMKNAFFVATGKMTRREMADALVKETFVASASFAVGVIGQTILAELPALGFMIGSFVGSVIGNYAYTGIYQTVLSFCVDTGFTMFGLVNQDYALPTDILEEIGVDIFEYEQLKFDKFKFDEFKFHEFDAVGSNSDDLDIVFLRRGVIGIRQIGYV